MTLDNIKIKKKKLFTIFQIEKFLDNTTFNDCFENFPDNLDLFLSDNMGKYRIENFSSEMARIKSLKPWNMIFRKFNSAEFFNNVIALEKSPQDFCQFSMNPLTNFINIFIRGKKPYYVSFEFSIIVNGGGIAPHTDSRNKIVTMMLYFPSKEQEKANGLGTSFYEFDQKVLGKYENFENIHNDNNQFPDFSKDSKISYTSEFTGGAIIGFFKNEFSWHSVNIGQIPGDGLRRSLNINYYYGPRSVFWFPLSQIKKFIKKNLFFFSN